MPFLRGGFFSVNSVNAPRVVDLDSQPSFANTLLSSQNQVDIDFVLIDEGHVDRIFFNVDVDTGDHEGEIDFFGGAGGVFEFFKQ